MQKYKKRIKMPNSTKNSSKPTFFFRTCSVFTSTWTYFLSRLQRGNSFFIVFLRPLFKIFSFSDTLLIQILVSTKSVHFLVVSMIFFWSQRPNFGQKWLYVKYQKVPKSDYRPGNVFFTWTYYINPGNSYFEY